MVEAAYQLRMNGKADSAKIILEQILAEDSTNAAAWCELARTKHHIGLANPRELFGSLDDIQQTADAAVNNDSENVSYAYYRAGVNFVRAYAALMMGLPDAKEKVGEVVAAYESLLDLKPDYYQAMLYLVEILGIPDEMGGDSVKAEEYAVKLETMHPIWGAKARELRLPEGEDRIAYWQGVLENNSNNADVLEQLGKAYLYQEDAEQGQKYIEEALTADPKRQLLLLDLVRYHIMMSRLDSTNKEASLTQAEELVQRYIDNGPIQPLKAIAYEFSANIKVAQGDREKAEELRTQAAVLDPYYSKAFGVPPSLLFERPGEISSYHSYYFRPF